MREHCLPFDGTSERLIVRTCRNWRRGFGNQGRECVGTDKLLGFHMIGKKGGRYRRQGSFCEFGGSRLEVHVSLGGREKSQTLVFGLSL
jgi:hypothetical protein